LRTSVVELLLNRGAFGQATLRQGIFGTGASAAVSWPLRWYALAVFADALCQPLWRVVYAQHRPWLVLLVNGLQTTTRLIFNSLLTPALGHSGLALSAAIGLSLQAGVLGWWTRRRLGAYLPRKWWRDAGRIALATAIAGSIVGLASHQLEAVDNQAVGNSSSTSSILILGVGSVLGGLTYLIALHMLGLRILGPLLPRPPILDRRKEKQ
jgi:peptidoglycan biosynthesis protein MviN/MurJ (putative lipid II flippase)